MDEDELLESSGRYHLGSFATQKRLLDTHREFSLKPTQTSSFAAEGINYQDAEHGVQDGAPRSQPHPAMQHVVQLLFVLCTGVWLLFKPLCTWYEYSE